MWADTAKLPWKIMEIKPLQMAVASDNLPQSTQKATSSTMEAISLLPPLAVCWRIKVNCVYLMEGVLSKNFVNFLP